MRDDYEQYETDESYDDEYETGSSRKGLVIAGCIALAVVLLGGGAIVVSNMSSNSDTETTASISNSALATRDGRKFELGDKVVLSASTFTDSKKMTTQEISKTTIDSDLMNTPTKYTYNSATKTVTDKDSQYLGVGTYDVKLTLDGDTRSVSFQVVDTTAPQFVNWSDKIYIKQVDKESDIDFSKYFTVSDYAKTSISISPNRNEGTKKFDVTTAGEYYVIVTAVDASGNKTEKECVIDVLAVDTKTSSLLMTSTTDKILANADDIKEVKEEEESKKNVEDDESEVEIPIVDPTDKDTTIIPDPEPTPEPEPEPTPEPEPEPEETETVTSTIEDQTIYTDAEGTPLQGKITRDGKTYFFLDGIKQPGWQGIETQEDQVDYKSYYLFDAYSGEMVTGWYTDANGHKFWFGPEGDQEDGRMRTGSVVMTVDGEKMRYTFGDDGILTKEEKVSSSTSENTNGSNLTSNEAKDPSEASQQGGTGQSGSIDPTDTTVYNDGEGNPYQGIVKLNNNSYYFKDGIKQNGFVTTGGNTYYFDPNNGSAMSAGEIKVDDKWYLADTKGVIQKGIVHLTIKDASGASTTHVYGYDVADGHKLYGYQKIKGYYYAFDYKTGERLTGTLIKYVNKEDSKDIFYAADDAEVNEKYEKQGTNHFSEKNGRQDDL